MPQLSLAVLSQRRAAKLRLLARLGPVLQGSLVTVRGRCGHPRCRCARGQRHRSHRITTKVHGQTHSLYLPVACLAEARSWTQNYRRAKRLLHEISQLSAQWLRAQVPTRRARARNQAAAARGAT
jgi:hypothetical protein